MPVIYTGFACTPNFTDNVSVLGKAVNITSTLRGCKLTLIKTVMNTGKTFTVYITVWPIKYKSCLNRKKIFMWMIRILSWTEVGNNQSS